MPFNCPVCHDDLAKSSNKDFKLTPCGHIFHTSCIQGFLKRQRSRKDRCCPRCSKRLKFRHCRSIYPNIGDEVETITSSGSTAISIGSNSISGGTTGGNILGMPSWNNNSPSTKSSKNASKHNNISTEAYFHPGVSLTPRQKATTSDKKSKDECLIHNLAVDDFNELRAKFLEQEKQIDQAIKTNQKLDGEINQEDQIQKKQTETIKSLSKRSACKCSQAEGNGDGSEQSSKKKKHCESETSDAHSENLVEDEEDQSQSQGNFFQRQGDVTEDYEEDAEQNFREDEDHGDPEMEVEDVEEEDEFEEEVAVFSDDELEDTFGDNDQVQDDLEEQYEDQYEGISEEDVHENDGDGSQSEVSEEEIDEEVDEEEDDESQNDLEEEVNEEETEEEEFEEDSDSSNEDDYDELGDDGMCHLV